jgi:hypothetical protein
VRLFDAPSHLRQEHGMPIAPLATSALIAYHDSQGGTSGLALLFVFVGLLATAGWLIFSELEWRHTVLITVAGWVVGLALTFGF